jgi:hypothetical protein
VAFIVKRAVGNVGLNAMEYAGHSLRAGLATQAAMNGASELAIMKQTGYRSLATGAQIHPRGLALSRQQNWDCEDEGIEEREVTIRKSITRLLRGMLIAAEPQL